jgi:outer membrane protein assembly factor BamA
VPSSPRRARRPGLALALVAGALAASGCFLWPQPRGTEEHPTITGFDIEGMHAISESDLRARLATQESGRKVFVVPDPQRFDIDAFANDKRRIVLYYASQGYYRAKVVSADVVPDGPRRVRIRIRIDEGPPTHVTRIDLPGIDDAPEAKAKLRELPLKVGDVFTDAVYDATRAAVLGALTSTGWANAEVTQHAQVDPELNEARVTYTVKAGPRYVFGNVFVSGAASIPRARIREEVELQVEPGKVYDSTKLPKAQARVFDLGVFGGVRVSPSVPPPEDPKRNVPVQVTVREAPFRTIRAGPSFTVEAIRWELDGVAGWQHRNWLGGLRRLSLDAKVGYAWLPTFFNANERGPVGLLSADFTQPGVATRYVDLNVRAEVERGLEQGYNFWAQRLRLGTPFRPARLFTFVPSINLELYELGSAISTQSVTPGQGSLNEQALALVTCPGQDPSLCLVSYFEQRFVFDFRDDPLNTRKGLYLGLSVQEGFSIKGNGVPYFRLLPEARAFVNFPAGVVLAGRARVGFLSASGDVPIVARFMSGGPNFMRGYYTTRLSPVIGYCPGKPENCPAAGAGGPTSWTYTPIGGGGLVDGSVELRFPISGELGGATFLDFGNVMQNASDALNIANLQYAVGAGLRYKTSLGAIRIDLAGRLPGTNDGVQIAELCYVGSTPGNCITSAPAGTKATLVNSGAFHHEPIVSFHFSIGEAF